MRSGAARLAELIPEGRRHTVTLDSGIGNSRGGVRNADVLERHLQAVREALAEVPPGNRTVTIGGDCAVDLAPVEAALSAFGDRLALVWFDAHADLNTPESSPSGAFHGMVLRALIGDGPEGLRPAQSLSADRVVLAGARSLDPGERDLVERRGIRHLGVEQLTQPQPLLASVRATGAEAVYIHIDLDVLDPQIFPAVGTPEPGGLGVDDLLAAVQALTEEFTLAGIALTEYERTDDTGQEEAVLQRIVDGLFGSERR
ncbi:arginase family protein [Streptomyces chattanoogensis]|uniref:arginase family protein n=1 Tax=Streptomyces chattanoogensis TaxID=66876 RepID=UPI0036B65B49